MISVGPILVIDDDPAALEMAQVILMAAGYATSTAGDAFHGLRLVREVKPAVIVCDLMMPHMTGTDFFRTLASDPATAKTARVMMSGRVDADRSCAHAFLAKPFAAAELLEKVRRAIARTETSSGIVESKEPRWRG